MTTPEEALAKHEGCESRVTSTSVLFDCGYTYIFAPADDYGAARRGHMVAALSAHIDAVTLREDLARAAVVAHKGPDDTDAGFMRITARDLRGGFDVGGSNRRAAVARVLDVVADALDAHA